MDLGGQQARRAFVEHQRDRRIDELHRARRAGGIVRGAVRVFAADGSRCSIAVQRFSQLSAGHLCAMRHEPRPLGRPAQIAHQLDRQAERKVETADPGAGTPQHGFELCKRTEALNGREAQCGLLQFSNRNSDRLCAPRGAGEVDAVNPQRNSSRSAVSGVDWWPRAQTRRVRALAICGGSGWMPTWDSAPTTRSTERGTTAMPAPAATQAVMAWYEPYSITRSATTLARPSHASRRRRYEQPVVKASTTRWSMSFGAFTAACPLGVMSTSSSVNTCSLSRPLAVNGSATNAASISPRSTRSTSAPLVPVTSSRRTAG